MEKNIIRENRFELDVGYIKKSPCRECPTKKSLPECSDCCETLSRLQELLVGSISCTLSFSEMEEYSV
jgi:hypothetical protein